jgi:5-(carboxyamino)imidazole ribonucleotide synthase
MYLIKKYCTQNRLREKRFLNGIGVPTAKFEEITSAQKLQDAYEALGPKCVLKTVEMGYDGKGQYIMDGTIDPKQLWKDIGFKHAVLEQFVPFECEISVIVARDKDGASATYMPSENIHKQGILDTTIAPARIDDRLAQAAWDAAFLIADELHLIGLLTVEYFVTKDGGLLVNELAPRPHNSGHWTIDACYTSQFEQFIRAVCGLPLASVNYHSNAIMKNLIGEEINMWKEFVSDPECKVHIYGKKEARRGPKMGHITQLITPEDELWDMR